MRAAGHKHDRAPGYLGLYGGNKEIWLPYVCFAQIADVRRQLGEQIQFEIGPMNRRERRFHLMGNLIPLTVGAILRYRCWHQTNRRLTVGGMT